MSCFLLIHTSLDHGFTAISEGNKILAVKKSLNPREHGSFLHQAIHELFLSIGKKPSQIDAIGVTHGPGSYTGIRVGLSAAKGLGYALQKPLVLCSTLKALAGTAISFLKREDEDPDYVALIHARKSEYYCGVYDGLLRHLKEESLIDIQTGDPFPSSGRKRVFFGVGLEDLRKNYGQAEIHEMGDINEWNLAQIISHLFENGDVVNNEDAAPLYLKEAYTTGTHIP